MKIISVFILLIYWSIMITVPVIGKNSIKSQNKDLQIASSL